MLISFFEEFPTKENLSKLKLIRFPTKLYIAAKSLNEFYKIKNSIKSNFVKEVIYWPILDKLEGYWFSPFSKNQTLKRVFKELENKKFPILIDLELPLTRNYMLIFFQLFNFSENKKLINNFIKKLIMYTQQSILQTKNSQILFLIY